LAFVSCFMSFLLSFSSNRRTSWLLSESTTHFVLPPFPLLSSNSFPVSSTDVYKTNSSPSPLCQLFFVSFTPPIVFRTRVYVERTCSHCIPSTLSPISFLLFLSCLIFCCSSKIYK
jgi:hypothetical protein